MGLSRRREIGESARRSHPAGSAAPAAPARAAQPGACLRAAAVNADLVLDPWQEAAAHALEDLALTLTRRRRRRRRGAGGLYLWGPVGRGKTWLLDAFFDAVPIDGKMRVHFHSLFADLHAGVRAHRSATHAFDTAVEQMLSGLDLVCFDEFHFHDIGDAMLVSRLRQRLFERGIMLVTTSNYPPTGLLPNPLYHHLFEPAIDQIGRHMKVVELAGPTDYRTEAGRRRRREGFRSGALVWPGTDEQLATVGLRPPTAGDATILQVGPRAIRALRAEGPVVWFEFAQLCESPTSSLDLLALADRYSTWVVSSVPQLARRPADAQQRFVNLIDILHERDTRSILLCDEPPAALLAGRLLVPDTDRTASRLQLIVGRPSTAETAT